MGIATDHYTIKALFEQKQTFVVPKYQRGYAWDDEAVNDFIEDISECLVARHEGRRRHHFFGGVVTTRQEVHDSTRDNYEVIDGQQRLASFVLLAGCIIKHIESTIAELENKESSESLNDDDKKAKDYLTETVSALKRLYLMFRDNKGIEYSDVQKLILSKADKDFFSEVISGQEPEPERESHKRILVAWEKISEFVQSKIVDASPSASDKAKKIQQFLDDVLGKDCTAIFMCSDTKSEAYQIFQVLNDRGVHLGKGDLLRAQTLELLDDDKHGATQNKVADNWDDVLAYTPDSIDNYLSWYFSSMEGRRPKPVELVDEFLDHRFKCEDKEPVTTQDADRILAEVKQVNAAFSTLETMNEGEWPYPDYKGVARWDRERLRILVKSLKHTNAMPLLLSLTMLDPKVFAEVVACIERFVFRYKTIVNAHVGPMTQVYLEHAKAIRDSGKCKIQDLRTDLSELIDKHAPDSIFETAIREKKFSPSGKNIDIRYFFITIEDYANWYELGAQGKPKCKTKTRVFDFGETTIEHVYPKNPTAGDKDCELEIVKHALGNLTILGPKDNNRLANKPPDQKLQAFEQSNLKLNRDIAKNDKWTKAKVDKRTEDLASIALKVFVP